MLENDRGNRPSAEKYLSIIMLSLLPLYARIEQEDKENKWWLGSIRAILLLMVYAIECDSDFILNYDGFSPDDHYCLKGSSNKMTKKNILSKTEFVQIMNILVRDFDMAEKMDAIAREYKRDCLDGYAFFDTAKEMAIIKILETMFQDKDGNIEWWTIECEYGRNFQVGDVVDNGQEIDLSTAEALYDYLIDNMEK